MPLSADRLIRYEQLVAPRAHLGVLLEPDAGRVRAALRGYPAAALERVPVLDASLALLRARLRQRLELEGPVVVTGHQVEFFHAGVLAKSPAAAALADALGGPAVFLAVDSDLPKSPRLVVPQVTPGGLRRVDVDVPGCDPARPYEFQPRVPRTHWLDFFTRVAGLHAGYESSLLGLFADAWLADAGPDLEYTAAHGRARAATEAALGCGPLRELRISQLSATPEFRAFIAHLVLDAAACAERYNAAQAAFRARHGVRTPGRPVPRLAAGPAGIELPVWLLRPGEPRRRLLVVPRGEIVEVCADAVLIGTLRRHALARLATHEEPWPIERDGWALRPRALALSAAVRLLLADVFVHGIGGAKYDEVMEEWIQAEFGVAPWPMWCVTATLHLPLPQHGVRPADLAAARWRSRDIRYNPQRHLHGLPPELVQRRSGLVHQSEELRSRAPQDRATRRVVFREIRRTSARMLECDPWRPAEYDRRVEELQRQLALDEIARDREYFYALHPRATLLELAERLRRAVQAP